MPDRIRSASAQTTVAPAILGSAAVLEATIINKPKAEAWQNEAWGYYDTTGELRQGLGWLANALSRCSVVAAVQRDAGDDPTPLETGIVADAVAQFAGGVQGQGQLLKEMTPLLAVPGVGYAICDEGFRNWRVRSGDQLDVQNGEWRERVNEGAAQTSWRTVTGLPVKIWRPHPRYSWQPDSPVRAVLPVLRELQQLTLHIDASATSRLTSAGMLVLPKSVEYPTPAAKDLKPGQHPFMAMLQAAMETALQNRGSAAAHVPIAIMVPDDVVDKVQHLTFATPFDEQSLALREEARRRLASGLDVPAEIILGLAEANHWTAWQIEESAVKLHVVPMLATICDGLTIGYLRPLLRTLMDRGEDLGLPEGYTVDDVIMWYDTSRLTVRPDRSDDALALHDRITLSDEVARREAGFAEADKPQEAEWRRRYIEKLLLANPQLAPVLLPLLGIDLPEGAVMPESIGGERTIPLPDSAPPPPGPRAVPDTQAAPPPPPDADVAPPAAPAPMAASALADLEAEVLLASCDGLVHRALEKANARVRSLSNGRARPPCAEGAELATLHTCLDPEVATPSKLLADAWVRVPEVAERFSVDAGPLQETLDSYVRGLLAQRRPHTYDGLAAHLGVRRQAAA